MQISVIIPFYNRSELLPTALDSVLAQTKPAHEIIVADDFSPEDIRWIATKYPTVRVIRLPENRGPAGARVYAAKLATGTHIATLDGDDFWYPQKLEKHAAYAEKIGDPRGIYSHQQWVVEDSGGTVRPQEGPRDGELGVEYLYVRNGFIQTNTVLAERLFYIDLCSVEGGFWAEDYELVMRADMMKGRVYLLKEVLGQWNCITDPRRRSIGSEKTYDRDYLPRVASYFTPLAKAAFRGRWLAPRLIKQGQVKDGISLIVEAVRFKALSPLAALKVILHGVFPRQFKWAAAANGRLRGRVPQVPKFSRTQAATP